MFWRDFRRRDWNSEEVSDGGGGEEDDVFGDENECDDEEEISGEKKQTIDGIKERKLSNSKLRNRPSPDSSQLQFLGEWEPSNPRPSRRAGPRPLPDFLCSICGCSFRSKPALSRHASAIHPQQHKCRTCLLGFKTQKGRDRHELRHQNNTQKRVPKKQYRCHVCGKSYGTKEFLSRHLNHHTRKFACDSCGRSFRCGSHLKMHKTVHSKEKYFNCPSCEKSFHLKESLEHHLITHSVKRPFSCNICDKKFKTTQAKNRHELVHYRVS
ncbi:hypothetical protein J437_LFUL017988 [Ladona fulva]|uniref:C2H2-type domain-containing protein n=1 Tax=Ladona fulva TaxID=123851 RepID=A0A8K0P9X1_LADFU|nr:hypothetical protein J437_LFUL017988 [Ladona fulva]